MSERHDQFWAEFFGIPAAELGEPGVSVVSHVGLDGYRGVWFFLRGRRMVVSAPGPWVEHIRGALTRMPSAVVLPDQKALVEIFGSSLDRSIGPTFQGALDPGQLRTTTSQHVRALTDADSDAVSEFRDLCGVEDWDDSAIEKAQLLRCGFFDNGRVASIAGFRQWSPSAGDPCVLTLPDYRGRGYAKEVVGRVLAAAIAQGHVPLYQTLEANVAAVHVALGLGYVRYANHVAVRLSTEEPSNLAVARAERPATLRWPLPPLNARALDGQTERTEVAEVVVHRVAIRRATADDAEAIATVHAASIRGLASGNYSSSQISAWSSGKEPQRYRDAMAAGESMWVAQHGNEVVGFGSWRGNELRAIYVSPEYARVGVGTQLLVAVESDARANGCRDLRLESSLNAVPFYRTHGWSEVSRATRTLRSGAVLECVVMEKALD
jgi:putative acetyltransferase